MTSIELKNPQKKKVVTLVSNIVSANKKSRLKGGGKNEINDE